MPFDYQQWWIANGDAVKRRRRERYRSDSDYRRKQRGWSRAYQAKQPKQDCCQRRLHRGRRPIVVTASDQDFVCWTIGALASAVGVDRHTVQSWIDRGLLPSDSIQWLGLRYYTEEMIDGLMAVLSYRSDVMSAVDPLVYYEILAAWTGGISLLRRGYTVAEFGGVELASGLTVFTTDSFADLAGRQEHVILYWERAGLIPETPLRYGSERVFTAHMCEVVIEAMKTLPPVRVSNMDLVGAIRDGWEAEMESLGCLENFKTGRTIDVKELDSQA